MAKKELKIIIQACKNTDFERLVHAHFCPIDDDTHCAKAAPKIISITLFCLFI